MSISQDNFHDYLKFTFPRMKAPSFFVEEETERSLLLISWEHDILVWGRVRVGPEICFIRKPIF